MIEEGQLWEHRLSGERYEVTHIVTTRPLKIFARRLGSEHSKSYLLHEFTSTFRRVPE